jgi:hypothetical protein
VRRIAHSNLYLRRSGGELNLTIEHRAAPSPPSIALELAQRGDALALEVEVEVEVVASTAPITSPPSSVDERITAALTRTNRAVPISELRTLCRVRNVTLYEWLTALTGAGRLVRSTDGDRLATAT